MLHFAQKGKSSHVLLLHILSYFMRKDSEWMCVAVRPSDDEADEGSVADTTAGNGVVLHPDIIWCREEESVSSWCRGNNTASISNDALDQPSI
jgi:hypothetical protein